MAICPVCNKEIHPAYRDEVDGIPIHTQCFTKFNEDKEFYKQKYIEFYQNPEKYDGKSETTQKDRVQAPSNSEPSDKDFITTLLICVFLGGLGVHRFFVNKMGTGVLMLLTVGGFGIWWIIDIVLIVTGSFEDREGRAITYQNANTASTSPNTHVPEKFVEAAPAKDIPAEIQKLADLKDKGIITDEEFQQKKQELLERI